MQRCWQRYSQIDYWALAKQNKTKQNYIKVKSINKQKILQVIAAEGRDSSNDEQESIYASVSITPSEWRGMEGASSQFVFLTYDADNTLKEKLDEEELHHFSQRDPSWPKLGA